MAQLTGKTIIITGSSRGVGADTAQILAAEGANIVVNYRPRHRAQTRLSRLLKRLAARQSQCRLT